ncbi:MAG: phosphoglycolate phosphatase [Steroidobacteraceae bacterium]
MISADFRGVLFDLDGTLIDTAPDMIAALNQLLGEEGGAPLPYALARTQVSHGSTGLVGLAFPGIGTERFEQLRARFLALYNDRVAHETKLFDGALEVLDAIEASNRSWGIVTNKPTFLTTPLLDSIGLAARAGCVVCGDTLPQRKPHPAPLLYAADLIGVPSERCLYIGDAERDVVAAHAAHMPVVLASYGYLGPDDAPQSWGADAEIDSLRGLLQWLT